MRLNPKSKLGWFQSLRIRLILMMSLALLPIGLIALVQTNTVSTKARQNEGLALLALTEQAALQERLIIQSAFGAARGFAAMLSGNLADTVGCSRAMSKLVSTNYRYSFADVVLLSGEHICASGDQNKRYVAFPDITKIADEGKPAIITKRSLKVNGGSAVFVLQPFYSNDALTGYISITIPHTPLSIKTDTITSELLFDILTLNRDGEILSSQKEAELSRAALPAGFKIGWLSSYGSRVFPARNDKGIARTYTSVPIENGQVYVLGIWASERGGWTDRLMRVLTTSVFPVLMWIFSLGVALFAIHRLITRQIDSIGKQMLQFAQDRTSLTDTLAPDMPTELQTIQDSFLSMADSILREEAKMEDAMRRQSVLSKEVHHRVKNNLQLISSILNMQIRNARHTETKQMLRRIQDRVLSLATIHRDLYQTGSAGLVNVGVLVREVIEKTVHIGSETERGVTLDLDIDDVMLYPDQAVPMSLLAAEAATNAMKYVGARGTDKPWISLTFKWDKDEKSCFFEIANSVGPTKEVESTGLGAKLISAFAIQLDAQVDTEETDTSYKMTARFQAAEFQAESVDF